MPMMTGRYAVDTKVPASQSRHEIEVLLKRYGADSFGYAQEADCVTIGFRTHGRMLRFRVIMPDEKKTAKQYRQRWRALLLCIKGKLESVASGIEQFDEAFMANIVTPDGKTVAQITIPHIKTMYETGKMPPLLGLQP